MHEYVLGLDIGSSSVKASLVNISTGQRVASAQSPAEEMEMLALQPGWAEQEPETWWQHVLICIKQSLAQAGAKGEQVKAIGIAYQMHGLVCIDKAGVPVRPSIIWCDSRAVMYGDEAFNKLGESYCLSHFLNSPGNFTASKLKWVKENEPAVYERIHKIMLPGDYIAYKLSGQTTTTGTALSEGIFWDYKTGSVAQSLLDHYGISADLLPEIKPVFSIQAEVDAKTAELTGLKKELRFRTAQAINPTMHSL